MGEDSDCPDVAIDSQGNVHFVFEGNAFSDGEENGEGEIWYTMLDSNGNTLIDDTLIYHDNNERKPAIGLDSQGHVHIVWQSDFGDEIAYTKLAPYLDDRDGDAASLATIELVAADVLYADDKQKDPRIAIDSSDGVHIVWANGDNDEIAYMKLNSSGAELVSYTNVADTSTSKAKPFIAVDSNDNPHIIWNNYTVRDGERETFYAMLNGSNGNHLIDATLITDDDDWTSSRSDIVVDGERASIWIFHIDWCG